MVLPITNLQLFQYLKEKIWEKVAEALVTFIESKVKDSVSEANNQNLKVLATKEDINNINQKLAELPEKFANLRTEIATTKAEMIKRMFIFRIGLIGVISGLMITLFNFYIKH